MKKKKVIAFAIVISILLVVMCIIGYIYVQMSPLGRFKSVIDKMIDETYYFSVEYSVEGMEMFVLDDDCQGMISGTKGTDVLYGHLTYKDNSCLELYVDKDYEIILSVTPLLDIIMEKIQEKTEIPPSVQKMIPDEINVSMDQLEDILGKDIITISESGISSDLFNNISGKDNKKMNYKIEKAECSDEAEDFLGKDAICYSVTLKETDTVLYMGIPEDEGEQKIYLSVLYDDVEWKFLCEYEVTDVEEPEMPQDILSNVIIKVIKTVINNWADSK